MSDTGRPVEGPIAGGRYRAVSDPVAAGVPLEVRPDDDPTPGGGAAIGAVVEAVRRAATELDGLGGQLHHWVEATEALRLELGPDGRNEADRPPGPVRPDPVPDAAAVPGLAARRRRAAAELVATELADAELVVDDGRPHRFAAQESERALHALADAWSPALARRASDLHDVARAAAATAQGFGEAGGEITA